jgi:uncharacterized OsmC-like protein
MERRGLDRALVTITLEWTTADRPSRITALDAAVDFGQTVDATVAQTLLAAAERGCTVSNTLKHGAELSVRLTATSPNTA